MPKQTTTTETVDPETRVLGGDFDPVRIPETATEAVLDPDGVGIRVPTFDEGALMWEIARDAGTLDLNSPYAYMMQCRNFRNSCAIAEIYGRPAGFVTGHRLPDRPDTLFIWQIAVLPEFRGFGIARRMLADLLERQANAGVRTIEATVSPGNSASAALFTTFAESVGAELTVKQGFAADEFPDDAPGKQEDLFRITPVAAVA